MHRGNLFADASAPAQGERFETLLSHRNLVIERILTSGTPGQDEYVQAQDEWVVLLQGDAVLEVDGASVQLQSGDYLFLAAGVPHKMLGASQGALWLAVHLHGAAPDGEPG
ncbi:cupin domain-containing protein [Lysobacter fragariae]